MLKKQKKSLHVQVSADLFKLFSKLCIDAGISKAQGITLYLEYLQAKNGKLLNEKSTAEFKLDARKPK